MIKVYKNNNEKLLKINKINKNLIRNTEMKENNLNMLFFNHKQHKKLMNKNKNFYKINNKSLNNNNNNNINNDNNLMSNNNNLINNNNNNNINNVNNKLSKKNYVLIKKRHHQTITLIGVLLLLISFMDLTNANWWQLGTYTLHTMGLLDRTGTLQSHTDLCQNFNSLTTDQRRICSRSPRVTSAITMGARFGREECQQQFRHSRWNCSVAPASDTIYGGVVSIKSRETAYVHAINAASLAWSITRACSKGDLSECACDNNIRRKQRKWQWGGCSEDVNYGVSFSRKFIDSQENNETSSGLMNLHNNEAGRRALRSRMQRVCKCHGMSGSCSISVCWRRLPSIRAVGEALGVLYDGASHVKLVEREGKPSKLRRRDPDHKKLIKSDLVYLEDSPDYCERNDELGIMGTRGRLCNRTSHGIDGCRLLCCGRGYQTRIRHVEEKCRCRFVWCCTVKCEMCNHRREEHICN